MWPLAVLRQLPSLLRQDHLPLVLRVYVLAPLTVAAMVFAGGLFPLPPGPLCDEGMVLFMEGGCDWGVSNIFFFSKAGLLLALNVAFVVAARSASRPLPGFLVHLLVLAALAWGNQDAGYCESYYGHPNGNVAQMVVEGMAFAGLGMALLPWARGRSWPVVALLTVAWNAVHVAVFYAWLADTAHWTWRHTWEVAATLLVLAGGALLADAARRTWAHGVGRITAARAP
jgi:hypothetical protein